jgi:hypothetical protein
MGEGERQREEAREVYIIFEGIGMAFRIRLSIDARRQFKLPRPSLF